jgi:hypothetical protein
MLLVGAALSGGDVMAIAAMLEPKLYSAVQAWNEMSWQHREDWLTTSHGFEPGWATKQFRDLPSQIQGAWELSHNAKT